MRAVNLRTTCPHLDECAVLASAWQSWADELPGAAHHRLCYRHWGGPAGVLDLPLVRSWRLDRSVMDFCTVYVLSVVRSAGSASAQPKRQSCLVLSSACPKALHINPSACCWVLCQPGRTGAWDIDFAHSADQPLAAHVGYKACCNPSVQHVPCRPLKPHVSVSSDSSQPYQLRLLSMKA